jgi:hypothetical protein
MLSKELLQRLETFTSRITPDKGENYIEKYLKKLQSETEIQDYRMVGTSIKVGMLSMDIKYKDEWYRVSLLYTNNKFYSIQVISHEDFTDVYMNSWVNQMALKLEI